MSATRNYLALDLGASSGRAIIGRFDGERLALEEVHRFANGPVHIPSARGDSLHWDTLRLFVEIKEGLTKAAACCGSELVSLGIDTWGVDYGLLDRNDRLLGLPYHYRDSRTDTMMDEAFRRVPARGDLRGHRHPVHAAQHALPASRPTGRRSRSAGARRTRC